VSYEEKQKGVLFMKHPAKKHSG